MFLKITSHKLFSSLQNTTKPCLSILLFSSICAILNHFYSLAWLYNIATFIVLSMPYIFSGLLTYYLCDDMLLSIIAAILIYINGSSYTCSCLLIPLAIYYINKGYLKLKEKTLLKDVPKFVENSITIIFFFLSLLLLAFVTIPFHFDIYVIIDSLPFLILVVFCHCFCFYKGYHPALLSSIIGPLEVLCLTGNLVNYLNGIPLAHYLTHGVISAMASLSGTGITIGIVLLGRSHFPKGTLLNSFFGVNEPVIFGLPVTNHKEAFIPFVIGGTIMGSLPFVFMKLGYLNLPILDAPYIGLGLEGLLVNLDYRSVLLAIMQIILSILFWYPYYRKELKNHDL